MRFAFTSDQEMLRDGLREVLKRECPPSVVRAAWSDPRGYAEPLWKALAESGVVGATVSEAHGGLGLDPLDLVLLFEECGRAAMPAPLVEGMAVAVPLLRALGDDSLQTKWLPRVARGESLVVVGLARAPYVVSAHVADLLLLEYGDEIHAVEARDVRLDPEPSVDGARRLFRVDWTPRDASRIARGDVVRRAVDDAAERGAVATAAELLGLARQMIDVTVEYVKVRKQFGSAVGSFQAVKHHLASALVKLELARPVVIRAAYSLSRGDAACSLHASMAKARASEAALVCARAALQCHGAIGYSFEHDLHLWMKRAWALASAWGDAAHHRGRVAAALLGGEPLSGGTP